MPPRPKATTKAASKATELNDGAKSLINGEVSPGMNGNNEVEDLTINPKEETKGRGRGKKATVEKPAEKTSKKEKGPSGRTKKIPAEELKPEIKINVAAPKGRGKKLEPITVNVIEAEPENPPTKGRKKPATVADVVTEVSPKPSPVGGRANTKGRGKKAATVIDEVDEKNGVEGDDVQVAPKGRKRKEPTVKQTEASVVTAIISATEEKAVPPKKRASNKKIKDVEENTEEKKVTARGRVRKQTAANIKSDELDVEEDIKTEELTKASPRKKAKSDLVEVKKPATKKRGKASKEQIDEVTDEVKASPADKKKPAQRGRKRVAVESTAATTDGDDLDGAKPAKNKKTAPLNDVVSEYNKNDFELPSEKSYNFKISSWNVAGLRSWLKKDGLKFLEYEEPDIFCLQETKCTTEQLPEEAARIPGYHPYWLCMPGGHAGVAIYSKIMPINVEYGIGNKEFDDTGRIITAEYEKFFLICVYVPNSGRKLVNLEPRLRWEKLFQAFVENLNARKPVVICGDMNVSHEEIDLANPKANVRNAGFTKEEREKMTELLALGYVDTFRHFYPKQTGAYTYWTYMANARSRNVGWRLDYFLVSERFVKRVVDNCIRTQCKGSDHCPITLFLSL